MLGDVRASRETSQCRRSTSHYVQCLINRLNHELVRAIYDSGADTEGRAVYCEQMMLDARPGAHHFETPVFDNYGRRLEVNVRFFGRLITTETIAAASRSSKSKSTPTDFCSSRLGELDLDCEFFLAITAGSYRYGC